MQHNNIGVRQTLYWLYAKAHNRTPIFNNLDIAFGSWHTIHALWLSRAWDLKIATPNKLTKLIRSERIA